MNLVLAVEADSSQTDPLGSIVRTKLGAELVHVTSADDAIVAMNQRVPALVLVGRELPQEQRVKVNTHLRRLAGSFQIHTLDIPPLHSIAAAPRSGFPIPFRKKNASCNLEDVACFEQEKIGRASCRERV